MNTHFSLSQLFSPRSIAVVGASATPGKIGAMPISLLRRYEYDGRIIPVNPRVADVQGLPAIAGLDALDEAVDLVILAVPAAHAAAALERACPGQIGAAVVFTSGFSEIGPEGQALQAQLCAVAKARGIRLLGPNCLGFMNIRSRVYATFTPAASGEAIKAGGIGMVTQSGAFGAYAFCMARDRGLGLSHWISTGNEADIDVADCIAYLAHDEDTRVVMAYMEGCRDGDKLRLALAAARDAGKPVVVTKIGRTQAGAQAAASHTAALAGDDAVYDALFRQYGAVRARSIEEFFNLGYAFDTWKQPPQGRRLGILTISGGVGALMADEASDAGLTLPSPTAAVQQRLLERMPFGSPRNPIDVTGQAVSEPGLLLSAAEDVLADGIYDAMAVFLAAAGSSEALWPTFETFARTMQARHPKVPLAISALFPPARRRELEALGCLVFADPSAAVKTLAAVVRPSENASAGPAIPATPSQPLRASYNEVQAMEALALAGIAVSPCVVVQDAEGAVAAAGSYSGPVVLKIVSPDILHKSDIGGVRLNVIGDAEVSAAYDAIVDAVSRQRPDAAQDGVLVSPMAPRGVECIIGVHRDPIFGPIVMFGLGGIFVEVLKDVSFRLAPFGRAEALAMIAETKGYAILSGARGSAPADIDALADALVALSIFASQHRGELESVEVNPLVVLARGKGVIALDAVITTATAG
ncbi:acetate--CoA ligase family protein [Bordetella sp. N]|uniref:acetate--CoA ligase family protein n=1 Tax=Bordetella sp. N TaxID=1746199 RepID=UPI00070E8831|nr:acetate--CoA ligase family protein [Bordetella sp. N]ALM83501.1 6-carboxyhexanoate--CoA ligase [Bordetella sp. N]